MGLVSQARAVLAAVIGAAVVHMTASVPSASPSLSSHDAVSRFPKGIIDSRTLERYTRLASRLPAPDDAQTVHVMIKKPLTTSGIHDDTVPPGGRSSAGPLSAAGLSVLLPLLSSPFPAWARFAASEQADAAVNATTHTDNIASGWLRLKYFAENLSWTDYGENEAKRKSWWIKFVTRDSDPSPGRFRGSASLAAIDRSPPSLVEIGGDPIESLTRFGENFAQGSILDEIRKVKARLLRLGGEVVGHELLSAIATTEYGADGGGVRLEAMFAYPTIPFAEAARALLSSTRFVDESDRGMRGAQTRGSTRPLNGKTNDLSDDPLARWSRCTEGEGGVGNRVGIDNVGPLAIDAKLISFDVTPNGIGSDRIGLVAAMPRNKRDAKQFITCLADSKLLAGDNSDRTLAAMLLRDIEVVDAHEDAQTLCAISHIEVELSFARSPKHADYITADRSNSTHDSTVSATANAYFRLVRRHSVPTDNAVGFTARIPHITAMQSMQTPFTPEWQRRGRALSALIDARTLDAPFFVRAAPEWTPLDELMPPLRELLEPFASAGRLRSPWLKFSGDAGELVDPRFDPRTIDEIEQLFASGSSIRDGNTSHDTALANDARRRSVVLRLERLVSHDDDSQDGKARGAGLLPSPFADLLEPFLPLGTEATTAHVYVSAEGASALGNHTDITDVLILQLAGRKEWLHCSEQNEESRAAPLPWMPKKVGHRLMLIQRVACLY